MGAGARMAASHAARLHPVAVPLRPMYVPPPPRWRWGLRWLPGG